jgi:A/G-specific adenine glycosylase
MKSFSNSLVDWYLLNKRELPWRDISDPYSIWISEIILQQTRVNQGLNYYLRFIEKFPTVEILAKATEDEVLKYWQGLGYYSRARNIHKAASQILNDFNGVFPTKHADVLKLAGIGVYTSAAICSFAYNQPYAVVDGNVYRVLSRLFALETPIDTNEGVKIYSKLAQELLNTSQPAIHNQAIMEFGALQCVPTSPNCLICPLVGVCKAYQLNMISQLPVKSQKVKVKDRFFNYFYVEFGENTFLKKRDANDIWRNLYEFPLIESDKLFIMSELVEIDAFKNLFKGIDIVKIKSESIAFKHILTHRRINAKFFNIEISNKNENFDKLTQVAKNELDKYAVSRLIEMYLEKA